MATEASPTISRISAAAPWVKLLVLAAGLEGCKPPPRPPAPVAAVRLPPEGAFWIDQGSTPTSYWRDLSTVSADKAQTVSIRQDGFTIIPPANPIADSDPDMSGNARFAALQPRDPKYTELTVITEGGAFSCRQEAGGATTVRHYPVVNGIPAPAPDRLSPLPAGSMAALVTSLAKPGIGESKEDGSAALTGAANQAAIREAQTLLDRNKSCGAEAPSPSLKPAR